MQFLYQSSNMFYWRLKIHGILEGGRACTGGKAEWQRANKDTLCVYSNLSASGYRCFYGAQGNMLDKCKVHNRPSETGWVRESGWVSEREREGEFELAKAIKWGWANSTDVDLSWDEVGQTGGVCLGVQSLGALGCITGGGHYAPMCIHFYLLPPPNTGSFTSVCRATLNIIKANGNMTISWFNLTVPWSPRFSHLTK